MKASARTNIEIIDLIQKQIGFEFGSMVQYFTIASRFDKDLLPELNTHFSKLAERKKENALRFMDFASGHGRSLKVEPIPAPQARFNSTAETVELSLKKEMQTTDQYNALARLAREESDRGTGEFIGELISEETEEVELMKELLGAAQKAGENNLLMVEDFLIKKTSVAVEL